MGAEIKLIDAPLGHEIRGVDIGKGLSDADFRVIEDAYDRYGVIIIRGQQLSPQQQVAFSRRFGPLDRYVLDKYNMKDCPEVFIVSNIIENGKPVGLGDAGRYWHSDMWVTPNPSRGSMLHAIEVPHDDTGKPLGDTWFISMQAAYDALPEALRAKIEGRMAVYSGRKYVEFRKSRTPVDPKTGQMSADDRAGMEEREKNIAPEISHRMVRIHPRTGRKSIYYSEGSIDRIEGYSREESEKILDELHRHIMQPQFQYKHSWKVGDIVMWDNCSCIHNAIGDFEWPQRRRMHRTTLGNPAPIFKESGVKETVEVRA